ncbi:hypothetical protein OIU76_012994 [Salix suchowensis]|nr:hypothetical protein OIU76_012994 [Salix suchowensis]
MSLPLSFPLLHNPQPHTPNSPPPGRSHRLTESLLAPQGREQDLIFFTESGHLLLLSPGIARLILIGDNPTNFSDSSSLAYRKREMREFRRRLRFKRMSNLVRTEIRLCAREGF